MIPKVIHYCWFGGGKKTKLIKKCINSWRCFCPGYEIKEWNENNFDLNCCKYVEEAYKAKKWAFVSDYARHYILNVHGGIYLDTDVELLKSIDKLTNSKFVALEDKNSICTGLIMACEANDDYCRWMLSSYIKDSFVLLDGTNNLYTVCQRTTDYFLQKGFVCENRKQIVDGYIIYPTEYFCPYRFGEEKVITDNTYSVHHYAASWISPKIKTKRFFQKLLGRRITQIIVKIKLKLKKKR